MSSAVLGKQYVFQARVPVEEQHPLHYGERSFSGALILKKIIYENDDSTAWHMLMSFPGYGYK